MPPPVGHAVEIVVAEAGALTSWPVRHALADRAVAGACDLCVGVDFR
jgi:hypothetical protein